MISFLCSLLAGHPTQLQARNVRGVSESFTGC